MVSRYKENGAFGFVEPNKVDDNAILWVNIEKLSRLMKQSKSPSLNETSIYIVMILGV
jgi:hypothetical protein